MATVAAFGCASLRALRVASCPRYQQENRPPRLCEGRFLVGSGYARLGRRLLIRIASLVTPDIILRWHRRLIAAKWTYPGAGTGGPGVMKKIRRLIVRMATENSSWGYCRIQGSLQNLGHRVSPSTVRNVLKENGIRHAPNRPTTWGTFLKAHWGQIVSTDFFSVEVWTKRGLRTHYVLFFLDLETRRVHFGGLTKHPNDDFMAQAALGLSRFLGCHSRKLYPAIARQMGSRKARQYPR